MENGFLRSARWGAPTESSSPKKTGKAGVGEMERQDM